MLGLRVGCLLIDFIPNFTRSTRLVRYGLLVLAVSLLVLYSIAWLDQALSTATSLMLEHGHHPPDLLHIISRHQLQVFLAANVATGGVNLCVDTLSVPDTVARVVVLPIYMIGVCAVPLLFLRTKRDYDGYDGKRL